HGDDLGLLAAELLRDRPLHERLAQRTAQALPDRFAEALPDGLGDPLVHRLREALAELLGDVIEVGPSRAGLRLDECLADVLPEAVRDQFADALSRRLGQMLAHRISHALPEEAADALTRAVAQLIHTSVAGLRASGMLATAAQGLNHRFDALAPTRLHC